jgi:hypothetical protein
VGVLCGVLFLLLFKIAVVPAVFLLTCEHESFADVAGKREGCPAVFNIQPGYTHAGCRLVANLLRQNAPRGNLHRTHWSRSRIFAHCNPLQAVARLVAHSRDTIVQQVASKLATFVTTPLKVKLARIAYYV